MRRLASWLRDVPLADPLERRNAPALQLMLLGLAGTALAAWGLVAADGPARFDLAAIAAAAIIALFVVRRGHLRGAVGIVLAGFLATLGVSLLVDGLEAQRALLPVALVPLALASQLVGRRALWAVFGAVVGLPLLAALRDVPDVWPGVTEALNPFGNAVLGSFALSALVVTVILDRLGVAVRRTYRETVEQAARMAEAHARLLAAESRFRAAIEGSLDAFVVFDAVRDRDDHVADFVPLEMNERAARLFGLTRQHLLGQRLSRFHPEAFFDGGFFTTWARVVETRETVEEEFAPVAPLGGATWLRQQVVPVGGGVAVILRDLTGLRAAEQAMSDLRAQFLQSQKMEVVGILAGSVAHDFNNLLTVIAGHAELLLTDGLEAESREGVEQILLATERAVDLTRSLLAFSRKRGTSPRVIRLRDVLQRSRAMWQRLVGLPVTLVVDLEDDVRLRVDEGEFDQIILNLLVNARDAMPSGGRVTLRLSSVPSVPPAEAPGAPPGPWVLLEVADTGVGMDEETLARVFEPFYTTKPDGRGTGLGLPTVRRLVTEQGGRIAVSSVPGGGTTFRIYWPQAEALPDAVEQHAVPASAPGSETVLFLDDDPSLRSLFEASLSGLGYRVLVARSGGEACDLVARERVDVLVADIELPDMHGAEVAARVRQVRRGLPVIFFSACVEPPVTVEPAQRFLQKPVTPRELATHIRAVLDEASAGV